jgi:hypothetical protein
MRYPVSPVLIATALLTSCGTEADRSKEPIKAFFIDGGPPAAAKLGDRILAEGRLRRVRNGFYVVDSRTVYGKYTDDFCMRLEGTDRYWSPKRWQAAILADGKTVVAVTGKVAIRFPPIVPPGSGEDFHVSCDGGMTVEGIVVR